MCRPRQKPRPALASSLNTLRLLRMTDLRKAQPTHAPKLNELQRLGKNTNGYFGETIDIDAVLHDCVDAAQAHGWSVERIPVQDQFHLLAFLRHARPTPAHPSVSLEISAPSPTPGQGPRIYVSSGIHGDEPAAPLAALQLLQEDQWPAHIDLWLCPCLNPSGFRLNRREN